MLYKLRWIIASLITLIAVTIFAFLIWFLWAARPADPDAKQPISYRLENGTSVDEIARRLEEEGIIKNAAAFNLFVTFRGLRSGLKAGTYELNPNETMNDIAQQLAEGRIA
ncbi:MAG TPA: endolytic transglycosylase MltG, partial [Candidatus Saccharimonadia bacterium]